MSSLNVHFINGKWKSSFGSHFTSKNPATGAQLWEGASSAESEVNAAVSAALNAFPSWSALDIETRIEYLNAYADILEKKQDILAEIISSEMGKPLWESLTEVQAMINKIGISIKAYDERCPEKMQQVASSVSMTRHKPHGVVGVIGPYNFPGHLPNGHIIPALLAGNTIVFKPSELTPLVGETMVSFWEEAELPPGVLNLIQGGSDTGRFLTHHPDIRGLFFTGSWRTGKMLQEFFISRPGVILALEMGGNNPLIVWDSADLQAAAFTIIQSSFLTSGQRCTCARRLIIEEGSELLNTLIPMAQKLKIGPYTDNPEPYMGPVISPAVAKHLLEKQESLLRIGGESLLKMESKNEQTGFVTPGIIDVTNCKQKPDDEVFGPLIQVIRVDSFEAALAEANRTEYGLAAGLISDSKENYMQFLRTIRAGVVNWNTATTGASSSAPFGGIGKSGNFRPSAYYAADYCAYPVASMERPEPLIPDVLPPGMQL